MNELLDQIALRLRHNAAMDTIDELATETDRYDLLYSVVVCDSPALLDASLVAARAELARRACSTERVAVAA